MVNQLFRLVRAKDGFERWKYVDGPMSCSCNDDDDKPYCSKNPGTCIGIGVGVCVLLLTPWPDDIFIPILLAPAL